MAFIHSTWPVDADLQGERSSPPGKRIWHPSAFTIDSLFSSSPSISTLQQLYLATHTFHLHSRPANNSTITPALVTVRPHAGSTTSVTNHKKDVSFWVNCNPILDKQFLGQRLQTVFLDFLLLEVLCFLIVQFFIICIIASEHTLFSHFYGLGVRLCRDITVYRALGIKMFINRTQLFSFLDLKFILINTTSLADSF